MNRRPLWVFLTLATKRQPGDSGSIFGWHLTRSWHTPRKTATRWHAN